MIKEICYFKEKSEDLATKKRKFKGLDLLQGDSLTDFSRDRPDEGLPVFDSPLDDEG
jgi:hypothetical protein